MRDVTSRLGQRTTLVCVVSKLGNYTVSWIYKSTNCPERVMVLTSGPDVFSSDQRWRIKVCCGVLHCYGFNIESKKTKFLLLFVVLSPDEVVKEKSQNC